jgi:hypothetical protein
MDIQTIKHLQGQRAAITLILKAENIRNKFTEFNLYAIFEISNLTGKKLVPATVLIDSNRYRHSIVRKLADAGLSYVETPLAGAASGTSPESCSPEPKQCQRSCYLCNKTDLGLSAGCYNPSVFSPADGDWVCNVNLELSK